MNSQTDKLSRGGVTNQMWQTTIEGLSDGMTVLVTVNYNEALPPGTEVMNAEEESEGVYRFWDRDGSCFYFENPHITDNFVIVAWQPLPEPYDPNHLNHVENTREFGSDNG